MVLLETERAWAVALEAENDASREARKKYSVIGRLRKACIFSELLEKVCSWNLFDSISVLEIKVLTAFLCFFDGVLSIFVCPYSGHNSF